MFCNQVGRLLWGVSNGFLCSLSLVAAGGGGGVTCELVLSTGIGGICCHALCVTSFSSEVQNI